jgi:hypothetical protein
MYNLLALNAIPSDTLPSAKQDKSTKLELKKLLLAHKKNFNH